MQATLLGLSTLIILALLAALVGPHFVDFNHYRPQLETEATRLTGVPLRVDGPIQWPALLPTPSLVLDQVEAGRGPEHPPVRVRKLSVELALGPLLRGEWQAADVRVVGPDLRVALDPNGHVIWPISPAGIDLGQLSIRRLMVENGRVVLDDAASVTRVVLDKVAFLGEVLGSFLGPLKGDGSFQIDGQPYSYAVNAGRVDPTGAIKVRLGLNPSEPAVAIEAEGMLNFGDALQFEGTASVTRQQGTNHGVAFVPSHATGQVKATPKAAVI